MDYFNKLLGQAVKPTPKPSQIDHAHEFNKSWNIIKNTLLYPDERQLTRGIKSTEVPARLQSMVDSLVWESSRTEEGMTGACLEYLLKNDVLGTLVRLSETDRPFGIQAEVLRAVQNMVVLLDEQFLVHSAVHRSVLRLLRNCVGDDLQEQLDGRNRVMGAAQATARSQPSEYEEDLVNLLCILCSRIRTYRELLMIFFHDKHWYRSAPLSAVQEADEDEEDEEDDEDEDEDEEEDPDDTITRKPPSLAPSQKTADSSPSISKKPEYEFLLFNYLLRFVHREGQIGDFARAGLLFLMDVAMSPGEPIHRLAGDEDTSPSASKLHADPITDAALALAEYILDGDFSEVLGAGLGAVYSLLPYKLNFRGRTDGTGNSMILGGRLDQGSEEKDDINTEDATSPDFRARLDHFLKLLEFLQDVLRRNKPNDDAELDPSSLVGTAIVQSILDAVRRIFLENVLYPSILECSDIDGSAVAVMSYVEIMVRTLEDGQLADMIVNFLTSEDNDDIKPRQRHVSMVTLGASAPGPPPTDRQKKLHRRKSSAMLLLEMEAPDSNKQTDYFTSMARFTLKDLLLTNLKSKSAAASTAALRLFRILLEQHPQLAVERLLIVIHDPYATAFPYPPLLPGANIGKKDNDEDDEEEFVYPGAEPELDTMSSTTLFQQPLTTYTTHEREMSLYLALVSRVDPAHNSDAFSTGFEHYLNDSMIAIQRQSAYSFVSSFDLVADSDGDARSKLKHRLNPNDPLLSIVLNSLRNFFANTPEHNVALTGLLATLAIHPDRSLAGWMTFAPPADETPEVNSRRMEFGSTEDGDGDDRSIDFEIEERFASDPLPASKLDEKSRPVVHTILHGLVSQLERYRQTVDGFDTFLLERRRGLLFNENLTDALSLVIDISEDNALQPPPPTQRVQEAPTTPDRPKAKSKPSFMQQLLTPKKKTPMRKTTQPSDARGSTKEQSKTVSASPFGAHYQRTEAIVVEPFAAPIASGGTWVPERSTSWNEDEEDVFSAGWTDQKKQQERKDDTPATKEVTLSQLLDNVVILEECIKELAAIVHIRRSLAIDGIRYL